MASAGALGWGLGCQLDAGGGLQVSVAQFFLYLPSQTGSSGQDWVERDILLLISNLRPQLRLLLVTLYPTPPPTAGFLRPMALAES